MSRYYFRLPVLFQVRTVLQLLSVVKELRAHILYVTNIHSELKILPSSILLPSALTVEYSLLYNEAYNLTHNKQCSDILDKLLIKRRGCTFFYL